MARKLGDPPEDFGKSDEDAVQDIKTGVGGDEDIPVPSGAPEIPDEQGVGVVQTSVPETVAEQPRFDIMQKIHEISEAIVNEKWEEFMGRIGDLAAWQERVNMNISAIKQEIIRTQERFENLQKGVLGKVGEYDKGIVEIHTEMKALEKVFERILDPLVTNVKELGRITEKLKK